MKASGWGKAAGEASELGLELQKGPRVCVLQERGWAAAQRPRRQKGAHWSQGRDNRVDQSCTDLREVCTLF